MFEDHIYIYTYTDRKHIGTNISNQTLCHDQQLQCPVCSVTQVLFFPDPELPCNYAFHSKLLGDFNKRCNNSNCKFLPCNGNRKESSFMKLLKILSTANRQIDLCMFIIAMDKITDLLIYLHKYKGITVRIVTCENDDRRHPIELARLKEAKIEIKLKDSPEGCMHNKFVIVDQKKLLLGSPNWTYSGFRLNDEAVILTSQSKIVRKCCKKFDALWKLYENNPFTGAETNKAIAAIAT